MHETMIDQTPASMAAWMPMPATTTYSPRDNMWMFVFVGLVIAFVAAVLYFVLAYHLTNLYATEHHGVERFLLVVATSFLGALAAVLKRVNGLQRSLPGAIRVVSVTSVGARERLMLVEVGGQQLLVGAAPGRIQTLLVLDEKVSAPQHAAGRQTGGFAERLRDALNGPSREARP